MCYCQTVFGKKGTIPTYFGVLQGTPRPSTEHASLREEDGAKAKTGICRWRTASSLITLEKKRKKRPKAGGNETNDLNSGKNFMPKFDEELGLAMQGTSLDLRKNQGVGFVEFKSKKPLGKMKQKKMTTTTTMTMTKKKTTKKTTNGYRISRWKREQGEMTERKR